MIKLILQSFKFLIKFQIYLFVVCFLPSFVHVEHFVEFLGKVGLNVSDPVGKVFKVLVGVLEVISCGLELAEGLLLLILGSLLGESWATTAG